MVHIVVDLEMNWLDFKYENERKISTNEVIEIGAIAMNEKFEEIGVFKMILSIMVYTFNSYIEDNYAAMGRAA